MTDKATLEDVLEKLGAVEQQVGALTNETRGLVQAWNTATGLVKFVKLLSTLLAAIGAVYLFVKHGFKAG